MNSKRKTIRQLSAFLAAAILFLLPVMQYSDCSGYADTENSDHEFFSHCKAGILYEATTDTVLYEKEADLQLIPASMTKVMTAIITCEHNPNLEGDLVVTDEAVSNYYCSWMDYPHLKAGETISYYQAVEYMLLPSANEAASALSFAVSGGDRAAFVQEMNDKAKELGCEDTYFLDPHGLSPSNHVSCRDMMKIAHYAMSFDKIREILTHQYGVVEANEFRREPIEYGSILWPKYPDDRYANPYAEYITGLKTGWIPQSGYNFACTMDKDGLEYVSVAMGGEELDYPDGSGRIVLGDFMDTIEVLSLTDGLTADDLKKMHGPDMKIVIPAAIAVIAAAAIAFFLFRKKRT